MQHLVAARSFTQQIAAAELGVAVIGVLTEGGLIALSAASLVDDVVIESVGPVELDAPGCAWPSRRG